MKNDQTTVGEVLPPQEYYYLLKSNSTGIYGKHGGDLDNTGLLVFPELWEAKRVMKPKRMADWKIMKVSFERVMTILPAFDNKICRLVFEGQGCHAMVGDLGGLREHLQGDAQ